MKNIVSIETLSINRTHEGYCEILKQKKNNSGFYGSLGRYSVRSECYPAIYENCLYLIGTSKKSLSYRVKVKLMSIRAYIKILKAFELNNNDDDLRETIF